MEFLMLPGHPEFQEILLSASPEFYQERDRLNGDVSQVVDPESGLLRVVDHRELNEYLYGGEYDLRLSQFEEDEEF